MIFLAVPCTAFAMSTTFFTTPFEVGGCLAGATRGPGWFQEDYWSYVSIARLCDLLIVESSWLDAGLNGETDVPNIAASD